MSKVLDFFHEIRPEAHDAYFGFLKESSKHLDDKTRLLIQVVTKVISGSPRGLKQYIPQALKAGASGQEVIDAMLMAFPASGLTNLLNAFEAVMEMDIPELKPEKLR